MGGPSQAPAGWVAQALTWIGLIDDQLVLCKTVSVKTVTAVTADAQVRRAGDWRCAPLETTASEVSAAVWPALALLAVLVLGQSVGSLYLPTLNADIINNGVAKGDTTLHPDHRPHHARRCADSWPARHQRFQRGEDRDGVRPRCAAGPLPKGRELLPERGGPVRHPVADHPQYQRRAAGADAHEVPLADALHADDGHRQHHHGPPPGRSSVDLHRHHPADHGRLPVPRAAEGHPAVPHHAGPARPHQPDHAGEPERRAGHPGLRARRLRGEAVQRRQPGVDRHHGERLPAVLDHVPGDDCSSSDLSMVGIMWFGGHRVDSGGMPIGNLFAFISYVMQIAVLGDDVGHGGCSGAPGGRLLDPHPGCAQRATGHPRPRDSGRPCPIGGDKRGSRGVPRRRVPLSRRPGPDSRQHLLHGAAGPDDGDRRQHRQREIDADRAHPPAERRHRGRRAHRRGRYPHDRSGRSVEAHRVRSAEGLPLLGHRGQQPALRQSRRRPTKTCGTP